MRRRHTGMVLGAALVLVVGSTLASPPAGVEPIAAQGVGRATWTPEVATTTAADSRFLTRDDSITFRTDMVWNAGQLDGLARYTRDGLRYTHEINDRSGRLHASGFWATNLPDPAYDRDDDDGDGRWEEVEVIAGRPDPVAGRTYTTMVQLTRWHPKRQRGACDWAWDRRLGNAEVLSQLSRDLFGEWQAERFTLDYDNVAYPRVGTRPQLDSDVPRPRCREPRPVDGQQSVVVTFSRPVAWSLLLSVPDRGTARWIAFEAIGSSDRDRRPWTCGGPVTRQLALRPCSDMGVETDGVVAALGYIDGDAMDRLREDPDVARVEAARDSLTDLLLEVGGLGVELPGLTINDRYWELFLTE